MRRGCSIPNAGARVRKTSASGSKLGGLQRFTLTCGREERFFGLPCVSTTSQDCPHRFVSCSSWVWVESRSSTHLSTRLWSRTRWQQTGNRQTGPLTEALGNERTTISYQSKNSANNQHLSSLRRFFACSRITQDCSPRLSHAVAPQLLQRTQVECTYPEQKHAAGANSDQCCSGP